MKRPQKRQAPKRAERQRNPMAVENPILTEAPTEATANGTDDSEAKRPRLGTTVQATLAEAVKKYAKDKDLAEAAVIRQALYNLVGQEMPAEELTFGTKRKYESDEAREKAKKDRQAELKDLVKLAAQARAKGIDLATLIQRMATEGEQAQDGQAEPSTN